MRSPSRLVLGAFANYHGAFERSYELWLSYMPVPTGGGADRNTRGRVCSPFLIAPSVSGRLLLRQFEIGEAGFQYGIDRAVLVLRPFEHRTDDAGAHIDVLCPKRLPHQAGVHQHIAASGFLVELRSVKIDGKLEVTREFFLGRVAGFLDNEAKGVKVLFFEPLEFAHEHIPRARIETNVRVARPRWRGCASQSCF